MKKLCSVRSYIDITNGIPLGYVHINRISLSRAVLAELGATQVSRGLVRKSRRYPPGYSGLVVKSDSAISACERMAQSGIIPSSAIRGIWEQIRDALTASRTHQLTSSDAARLLCIWCRHPDRDDMCHLVNKIMSHSQGFLPFDCESRQMIIDYVATRLFPCAQFGHLAASILSRCVEVASPE